MEPITIVAALVAAAAGFSVNQQITKKKFGEVEKKAEKEIEKAESTGKEVLAEAKKEAERIKDQARDEEAEQHKEIKQIESRLRGREEALDSRLVEMDKRSEKVRESEDEINKLKTQVIEIRNQQQEKLEKVAKLKKSEAAEKLIKMTERDIQEDLKGLIAKCRKTLWLTLKNKPKQFC